MDLFIEIGPPMSESQGVSAPCCASSLHSGGGRGVTVRTFLALAAQLNLFVYQFDVKSAFLNGDLKEEVYVGQP